MKPQERYLPRILHVITSGDTGGAQTYVLWCCEGMRDAFSVGLGAGTDGALVERVRPSPA